MKCLPYGTKKTPTDQNDYNKTRNYWKYLKAKLKKEGREVVSATTQLKLLAPDGKKHFSDMLDYKGIIDLGKEFQSKKANRFIEWFTYGDETQPKDLLKNHLNQVFTHPYTPQENGHVESFHAILNQHLKKFTFWNISELEQNLILFQDTCNNHRIHGSIAHLTPNDFEKLWEKKQIIMCSNGNKRKVIFKLTIPRHQINQITGNFFFSSYGINNHRRSFLAFKFNNKNVYY